MTRRTGYLLLGLMSLCLFFGRTAWAEMPLSQDGGLSKVSSTQEDGQARTGAGNADSSSDRAYDEIGKIRAPAPEATEMPGKTSGGQALLTDLHSWSNPDYTRGAVTFDREVKYTYHRLKQAHTQKLPARIYLDFKGARIGPGIKDIPIGDGLLKMARVGQFRADIVRVVLDIENIRECKIFPLSNPFRVIIDVKGERKTEISRLDDSISAAEPEPKPERMPEERKGAPLKPKVPKVRRIVIDPGHGGNDPGAVGTDGVKEKDVVLSIGLKLARKIREETGIETVMTRSTDVFIPLEERTAIANKVNADLFVSIHANAALNKAVSGVETYYLNLAKTDKAARVAARENNISLAKVSLLQTILLDLMANHKINDSARMAEEVQKALHARVAKKYQGTRNLGVKQGPFYVLVGATMPSILVETAFISNEREAELLTDLDFQDAASTGILDGIRNYIKTLR